MASLREVIKEGMSINVDKGQLEIEKKIAKEKAIGVLGGFVGIKPGTEKEQETKKKKKSDEYRKEHNKLYAYGDSLREGPQVMIDHFNSGDRQRLKVEGHSIEQPEKKNSELPRSRMRVGGGRCSQERGSSTIYSDKRDIPDNIRTRGIASTPNAANVKEHDYSGMSETMKRGGIKRN